MKIDGTRSNDRAIEIVLGYYSAFNRGDWAGMLALLSTDVVHDLNQGGREVGRDAFERFLQRMGDSYREQLRDVVVMTSPDGSRAAAEYIVHGQYLASDADATASGLPPAHGQKYLLPGGAFFELRDGLIHRVSNYYNLREWIEQVR